MIMPYLHFDGNCEEAFRLYAEVFGGKATQSKWGDMPAEMAAHLTEAQRGWVMHAHLETPAGAISGGDQLAGIPEGNGRVHIQVAFDSQREAQAAFDKLAAAGGAVLNPMAPHPPPDDNGVGAVLTDLYGFTWILTAPRDRSLD